MLPRETPFHRATCYCGSTAQPAATLQMPAHPIACSSRNSLHYDYPLHRCPFPWGKHSRRRSLRCTTYPGAGRRFHRYRRGHRRPAQHHHRDGQPPRGKPPGRRCFGCDSRCQHRQDDLRCRCRSDGARRACAGPVRRKLQRSCSTAVLHSRPRQYRFRPRRIAARFGGDGRRRDGKRHAEILPDLRRRAHRSPARPAGHAVRPQHARRYRQDRHGEAGR